MKLSNPAGLWALIAGLALLLVLWLIRPRFDERRVSTTFLWKLSERFRKKRLPIRRIKRLLLLLLQMLCVATAALLIARPLLRLPGSGKSAVIVLDISASMTAVEDGVSRLDRAKEWALEHARALPRGSAVTLITAGASPERLLSDSSDISEIERALERVATDWSTADIPQALELAQETASLSTEASVTLLTDAEYQSAEGLQVVSLARGAWNAAITSFTGAVEGGYAHFHTDVASYGRDAHLTLALYVDDRLLGAKTLEVAGGTTASLDWPARDIRSYHSARITFSADDAISADNQAWCVTPPAHSVSVLLASDTPFYWERALRAISAVDLTVEAAAQSDSLYTGYDIYVFDGKAPAVIPTDGSVWLSAVRSVPREWGVRLNELVRGGLIVAHHLQASSGLESLTSGLALRDITVQRLVSSQETERFSAVLTAGDRPALLVAREADGRYTMLLTFDVHDSNLPLTADFVLLLRNMLRRCVPDMLPERVFECGAQTEATLLPLTTALYLERPDGRMTALSADGETAALTVGEPGVWSLLASRGELPPRYCEFTARIPVSESDTGVSTRPEALLIAGGHMDQAEQTLLEDAEAGMLDMRVPLAAALLALLVLEWVVHHREQY